MRFFFSTNKKKNLKKQNFLKYINLKYIYSTGSISSHITVYTIILNKLRC